MGDIASTYPAPWRADAYPTADGRRVVRVLAHDHSVVVGAEADLDDDRAAAIVRSRNEGSDTESIASIQARWQAALDAAHAETDRVRAAWHDEAAKLRSEVYRLQDELAEALKKKPGELF